MKNFHIIILLPFYFFSLNGQNEILLTNHFQVTSNFNPSFTGNSKKTELTFLARQQWIGFNNAPSTHILIFENYIEKIKSGIGIIVINDALGNENNLNFKLNYNYKLQYSPSFSINTGISFGLLNSRINTDNLFYEEYDPNGLHEIYSIYSPTLIVGSMVTMKLITFGISFSKKIDNQKDIYKLIMPGYYHLYMDYVIPVSNSFIFIPMINSIISRNYTIFDIGSRFLIKDKIHIGISCRLGESINGMLGYKMNSNIFLGYSYDLLIKDFSSYINGSHEIFINFKFDKKVKSYHYHKSPRYF